MNTHKNPTEIPTENPTEKYHHTTLQGQGHRRIHHGAGAQELDMPPQRLNDFTHRVWNLTAGKAVRMAREEILV